MIVGRGGQQPSGHIPFTPRAKKVLELSLRESQQLGHSYIGTEHLLLGLIRQGQGVAARVLGNLGVDLGRARQQVIELLGGGPGSAVVEGAAAVRIGGSRAQLEEILAGSGRSTPGWPRSSGTSASASRPPPRRRSSRGRSPGVARVVLGVIRSD